MVDLIADLSSNPDSAASERAEFLADSMLDGVSQQIIYPSAPTVSALIEVRHACFLPMVLFWSLGRSRSMSAPISSEGW